MKNPRIVLFGVLFFFIAAMAIAGVKAYTFQSGRTGQDVLRMQQMRDEAVGGKGR